MYNPEDSEICKEQIGDLKSFIISTRAVKNAGVGMWITIVHWCSRTILYHKDGRIVSKSEACRRCSELPELEPFREVFKIAAGRRYPYAEEVVSNSTKAACIALLKFMDTFLLPVEEQSDYSTLPL